VAKADSFIPDVLENSTTSINRATYVPLAAAAAAAEPTGRATAKANFVASLQLQPGEVQEVQRTFQSADSASTDHAPAESFWGSLRQFEGNPIASSLPPLSTFGDVSPTDLTAFGQRLQTLRQQTVQRLQGNDPTGASPELGSALIWLNAARRRPMWVHPSAGRHRGQVARAADRS
jgi:hypothetical protein